MGPIMATTAAVVMGASQRALRAFGLTIVGIVTVIFAAYLLSWVIPILQSLLRVMEILLRELTRSFSAAHRVGCRWCGGFYYLPGRNRKRTMGGVAIAISLVPPLCVVGISLQKGQLDAAAGAMLLFTNYLAILLAGGVVLIILELEKLGVCPVAGRIPPPRSGTVRFWGFVGDCSAHAIDSPGAR